jgi:hypothetical protein
MQGAEVGFRAFCPRSTYFHPSRCNLPALEFFQLGPTLACVFETITFFGGDPDDEKPGSHGTDFKFRV